MKKRKIFSLLLILLIVVMSIGLGNYVFAEDPTTGSLTILKYERGSNESDGAYSRPLAGVTFDIYKVDDSSTSTEIPGTVDTHFQAVTTAEGNAVFGDLAFGRYLVVESDVPENVTERIANFLVDIPMTNDTGDGLIYDVVVNPKNNTAYGTINLLKLNENNEPLEGVVFNLQKNGAEPSIWTDYPSTDRSRVETDENGRIKITGLPAGNYRLVELDLGDNEGYILDNQTTYEFQVALKNTLETEVIYGNERNTDGNVTITVLNQKPELTKEITSIVKDTDSTNDITDGINSADFGSTVSYKVEVDVPYRVVNRIREYSIEDTVAEGLTLNSDSLVIIGTKINDDVETLAEDKYTKNVSGNTLKIDFDETNINEYKKFELSYSAVVNANAKVTSEGNLNDAKLTYSNSVSTDYLGGSNPENPVSIDDTTTVYVGGFKIEKRAENASGELLNGAEFKLATSADNAKNNIFVKDAEGNEIVLTTVNGAAEYKGLAFGKYYLLETVSPSYINEGGEEERYILSNKPVEVEVNETSYESEDAIVTVINRKHNLLPLTGGIIGGGVIIIAGIALVTIGIKRKRNAN